VIDQLKFLKLRVYKWSLNSKNTAIN